MAELLIPFVMCTGREKQITVLTTTDCHGKIHINMSICTGTGGGDAAAEGVSERIGAGRR
jgi:hypothetical protein